MFKIFLIQISNEPKQESNRSPPVLQRSLSEDTQRVRPSVGGHLLRSRLSPQRMVEPESDSNVSVSSTGSLKRRRRQPKSSSKPPPLPPQLSHDMNSSDGGTSPDSGNYYGESESNDGGDEEDDGSIGDTAKELKSLHLRKAGRYSKL
jgi:hypothetical protein